MATTLGFALTGLGVLLALIVIISRLTGAAWLWGQETTLLAVMLIGGVQLIVLGIIGEYLGRIYDEVKNRPLYIVGKVEGFEKD